MILQALVKRYEDKLQEKLPFGWVRRKVDFAINIDSEGKLLEIVPLTVEPPLLPRPYVRSGTKAYMSPNFLCDDGNYLLGVKPDNWAESGKRHTELLGDSPISKYFARPPQTEPEKKNIAKTYCFQINGRSIDYDDITARNAWDTRNRESEFNGSAMCLVTGKSDNIIRLHGKVGAASLVSINAEAFASYGKTADDAAAYVGDYTEFAYVTALNEMLFDRKHSIGFGADRLVYWSESESDEESEVVNLLIQPEEPDADKLNSIMDKVRQGLMIGNCKMSAPFNLLCLVLPDKGRDGVRFFYRDSFGSIIQKIAEHYDNLSIYSAPGKTPEKFPYLPPWILLSETTVKKSASDASPLLAGQLLSSIVTGDKYPATLYNAILTRIRAGEEINRTKAAIVKAVLKRNYESEVAVMALNKNSLNVPYTLGRLFRVLEAAQASAGNTGIRERYFSGACSNPANVFPNLLRLSMHHSNKLTYGKYYEDLKTELIGKLDSENTFPATLNQQEQGEFIIGYYHQKQGLPIQNDKQEDDENV